MSKTLRATTALTAVVAASLIAGCAAPTSKFQVSGGYASKPDLRNIGLATRAQMALTAGDLTNAVGLAEKAVENSPHDAGFRTLLGNAYLASGRFASAEAAYNDALGIFQNQPAVAMKLVLAQIAQGKNGEALAMLDQLRAVANPADVGLAMALAGQPGNAIALLDEAARAPGADARTRQNLALAHALSGDWENARTIAAQDVPGDQLDARMAEWMRTASPQSVGTQVAALIGVSPAASDPGQPARLALRTGGPRMAAAVPATPVAPIQLAQVEPQPQPALPVAVQPVEPATVMNDAGFAAPSDPVAVPVSVAAAAVTVPLPAAAPPAETAGPLADIAQNLKSLRHEPVRRSGALPKLSELRRTAAIRFGRSGVVVQLGAYGSRQTLETGWAKLSQRHEVLARYTPATARFQAPIGPVYRLSLQGFASADEAKNVCQQLKGAGAACFVRNVAGDTAVRFASR
ncbi:tetratricopeptide repeat protein [Sphingomonas sp. BN140010]|uniref:Tetratricopeptide repeat protein n=1 Tax=Sphingomonas arvum TaxID=2992113 RepID=A0ABT3JE93_9SPHN|nr:SPOR domain-containing protein [Sphingomonas sp. BN140010]MCW3797392.1 tetratricopeptide repeat protein [Sphingomonas sp. BN140010]